VTADITRIAGDDVLMVYESVRRGRYAERRDLEALVRSVDARLHRGAEDR